VEQTSPLRFGPFELDVRAGEIRKHGVRIRLQDQSFQILLMLLDHPGEVVLREEIRRKLWPNNTIVEFDHSINAAIKRLRDALGESADNPRYIETLARRGYRFLGEVEKPGEAEAAVDFDDLGGSALSHYRLIAKLGSGGMGEVWKAFDPRLNREVAIKISAEQFTDRFEREAHVIAALNHTNICTLHDVGPNFLVMELIDGRTLAKRIAKGPIPLEEALAIARQIAHALEAAHDKRIVHRDLKPGNVMIRPDGTVKVLDFGLAKAGEEAEVTSESPTMLTAPGMIMGTPAYMSPEQARGERVDKRTDIWAFGVVLCEMLTGRPLFAGPTNSETIAAVLKTEPDLSAIPMQVRPVVERCLRKDPSWRARDIGDVRVAIEEGLTAMPATATPPHSGRRRLIFAVALALIVAVGGAAFWLERDRASSETPLRAVPLTAFPGYESNPSFSPDATR
jgi:DNA-binding winged helix-turn-helix (wHTH) protein/predicted Ser/Thr protein kinase